MDKIQDLHDTINKIASDIFDLETMKADSGKGFRYERDLQKLRDKLLALEADVCCNLDDLSKDKDGNIPF